MGKTEILKFLVGKDYMTTKQIEPHLDMNRSTLANTLKILFKKDKDLLRIDLAEGKRPEYAYKLK